MLVPPHAAVPPVLLPLSSVPERPGAHHVEIQPMPGNAGLAHMPTWDLRLPWKVSIFWDSTPIWRANSRVGLRISAETRPLGARDASTCATTVRNDLHHQ